MGGGPWKYTSNRFCNTGIPSGYWETKLCFRVSHFLTPSQILALRNVCEHSLFGLHCPHFGWQHWCHFYLISHVKRASKGKKKILFCLQSSGFPTTHVRYCMYVQVGGLTTSLWCDREQFFALTYYASWRDTAGGSSWQWFSVSQTLHKYYINWCML